MGLDIRQITKPEDDPSGFEALLDVFRADAAERDPGDPQPGPSEVAAELFARGPDRKGLVLSALLAGRPAALALASTVSAPGDDNQVAFLEILVKPEYRRHGLATALLTEAVPCLVELGQGSILAYPCADLASDAAVALCERYGLTARQEERCSRVLVADIDESLMVGWIADAATSAAGYRIEQWQGPCPEHLAEQWRAAVVAMEDIPLDDLDYNPYTRGVAEQRAADEVRQGAGYRTYRTLALSPEGEAAGISAIEVHYERPEIAHQDDTGVLAAHRGHRIGRWLKAANYQYVRRAHPELGVIETYNAQSNPWMLDINVAMGFRAHHVYTGYQGSIDTVASMLAAASNPG